MNNINTQYEDALRNILENGTLKEDRTGTGTISAFGTQLRFDLQEEGFPLLTTKKVFMRGLSEELFWFLRGSINSYELENINVNIWKAWADENGELGPVYGYVWRYAPTNIYSNMTQVPKRTDLHADYVDENAQEPNLYGVGYGALSDGGNLKTYALWDDMLSKCYNKHDEDYVNYGGVGVTVSPIWHSYKNFVETLHQLPLYPLWKENLAESYHLVHNYYGDTVFSPSSGIFLPTEVLPYIEADGTALQYDGKVYANFRQLRLNEVDSTTSESLKKDNPKKLISDESDWITLSPDEGKLWRPEVYIDQIEWLLNEIRTNPNSRRLIFTAWNPSLTDYQALPPCHTMVQFYVSDGKLSAHLYQRSGDFFLGIPFNIASYALLIHMIAQQVGLEVGELVHTIGDAHIYTNHLDQVKEQLSRDVRPFPNLELAKADSLYDYEFSDIKLVGYDPHPAIKADVSV